MPEADHTRCHVGCEQILVDFKRRVYTLGINLTF